MVQKDRLLHWNVSNSLLERLPEDSWKKLKPVFAILDNKLVVLKSDQFRGHVRHVTPDPGEHPNHLPTVDRPP